jgi:hypothetical protein
VRRAALLLALAAACATPAPESGDIPANRADVTAALYRQLEMVLERRAEIEGADSPSAEREREELNRLAAEITLRILRIDPDARPPGAAPGDGDGHK